MFFLEFFEKLSIAVLAAFLFSYSKSFRRMVNYCGDVRDRLKVALMFSLLSIIGSYTAVNVGEDPSLAAFLGEPLVNMRSMGVIAAGYIGGPAIGAAAGVVSGLHRYLSGAAAPLLYLAILVISGVIGGSFRGHRKKGKLRGTVIFIVSLWTQLVYILMVLAILKPHDIAISIEISAALPSIILNSLGPVIFIEAVRYMVQGNEAIVNKRIRELTEACHCIYECFRSGLNSDGAEKAVHEICLLEGIEGALIGDRDKVLYSNIKVESDYIDNEIKEMYRLKGKDSLRLNDNIVIYPIHIGGESFEGVIGIQFHLKNNEYAIKAVLDFLTLQIESSKRFRNEGKGQSGKNDILTRLSREVILNSITELSGLCRTNSFRARELSLKLIDYINKGENIEGELVPLEKELDTVRAYLSIEGERLGERLKVFFDIAPGSLSYLVPHGIMQLLVDNSIRHGISPKPTGGSIFVKTFEKEGRLSIVVEDTGVGISRDRLKKVLDGVVGDGIRSIVEKLRSHFGEGHCFDIHSKLEEGTQVIIDIETKLLN